MTLPLWVPDMFTQTTNTFVPCRNARITAVAARYGLTADDILQSAGFEANSQNFRVGDGLIKHIQGEHDVVMAQLACYAALPAHGMAIPELLCNDDGQWLTAYDGQLFLAMAYIPGRFYGGTPHELEALSRLIPSLCMALDAVPDAQRALLPRRPSIVTSYCPQSDYGMFGPELAPLLQEAEPFLVALSQDVVATQARWAPAACVHIDLHPRNLLWHNDQLFVLDFDSIQQQALPIALNFAMYKLFRRCIQDQQPYAGIMRHIYTALAMTPNPLAAQAEILFRLLTILAQSSPGNLSVWQALIPVHLRGLYEATLLLERMS